MFRVSVSRSLYTIATLFIFSGYALFPLGYAIAEEVPVTEVVEATPVTPVEPVPDTPIADPVVVDPVVSEPQIIVEQPISEVSPTPVVTQPTETTPGPQQPNGDAGRSYTYNPQTGLWENDFYTWDPITKQTKPKADPTYSYNPATGRWDTTEWVYSPVSGTYVANVVPAPALYVPQLIAPSSLSVDTASDDATAQLGLANLSVATIDGLENSGLGPDSANIVGASSSGSSLFDLYYNADISNRIYSNATTGDAEVTHNTTAGNATTGDASGTVNIINALNSSIGLLGGGNPVFFLANILGDVFGDFMIDPGQAAPAAATTNQTSLTDSDLQVKAQSNGTINNDVVLNTASGNATVAANTQAGSATSGNAYALANIVNAVNSVIGSGQSFMGMINIYGNFNGDILMPPGFMNSLLASNAVPAQSNQLLVIPPTTETTTTISNEVTLTDTSAITNTTHLNAQSGGATVQNNTSAGSATTGDASTNLTLFNLTGKEVVGKNAMLVFVNVLGSWVGLIMNASNGATAGLLGGEISENSTNTSSSTTIDATNTATINNSITANATSGNALVENNTRAGDAISGDAAVAVNILNISSNSFALSDWFGILFINVLGNWYGSFGVDTAAGNPITTPPTTNYSGGSTTSTPRVAFVPRTAATTVGYGPSAPQTEVLGVSQISQTPTSPIVEVSSEVLDFTKNFNWFWILIGLGAALLILFGDRLRSRMQQT